jgi:hypothetical protein
VAAWNSSYATAPATATDATLPAQGSPTVQPEIRCRRRSCSGCPWRRHGWWGSFGGGAALAWLCKRLHPQLAFYKLWALWTTVLGAIVFLLIAFGAVKL